MLILNNCDGLIWDEFPKAEITERELINEMNKAIGCQLDRPIIEDICERLTRAHILDKTLI